MQVLDVMKNIWTVNAKCLSLQIYNDLNWKNHGDLMIPKLCGTFCVIRLMFQVSYINTFKTADFVYFHYVVGYRIIV
jgi:hypothetical protein